MPSSRLLPLSSFLVLSVLLWPSPGSLTEARCGYPELPDSAQLVSSHFEEVGYFAEGQKVKVICENGLIGHERSEAEMLANLMGNFESPTKPNYSDDAPVENYMAVDSADLIVCQNSHWNSSGLRCLHRVELDARNVQVQWKSGVQAVPSLHTLVDRNAHTCLDIDLDSEHLNAKKGQQPETVLFSIRLDGKQAGRRLPRVVLMMKQSGRDAEQMTAGHSNVTLLEDLIMDLNSVANFSAEPVDNASGSDNGVEVEEAKRFLDFVYETEFTAGAEALNYSGPVKMMVLGEDDASDRRHKVLHVGRQHEVRISVSLGSTTTTGSSSAKQSSLECFFNEDAAITVERNFSTELLVFDCQSPAGANQSSDLIWVRLDIAQLVNEGADNSSSSISNETSVSQSGNSSTTTETTSVSARSHLIQLCGVEAFGVVESASCGKPYVPIYGIVTKTKDSSSSNTGGELVTAEYGCMSGYRAINLTVEEQRQFANTPLAATLQSQNGDSVGGGPVSAGNQLLTLRRRCDPLTHQWSPSVEDIYCEPVVSCRQAPPIGDARKFYFEYGKLDNLKRAIGGRSTATLRCLQVTDFVVPFTLFSCDPSGQWIKLTGNKGNNSAGTDPLPSCRSMLLGRSSRRGRPSHFHHHYYHYYQNGETPANRTSIIIFGRQINDNKYLIYYGAAGLFLLFGGSFIILFHVRRMAKKISRQMRERSYMAADKGVADHFLPVGGNGMDSGNLPPYYNNSANDAFYEGGGGGGATMFSNDLPPPATPISMPTSGLEKSDYKDKNNLSSNFDSIKF